MRRERLIAIGLLVWKSNKYERFTYQIFLLDNLQSGNSWMFKGQLNHVKNNLDACPTHSPTVSLVGVLQPHWKILNFIWKPNSFLGFPIQIKLDWAVSPMGFHSDCSSSSKRELLVDHLSRRISYNCSFEGSVRVLAFVDQPLTDTRNSCHKKVRFETFSVHFNGAPCLLSALWLVQNSRGRRAKVFRKWNEVNFGAQLA